MLNKNFFRNTQIIILLSAIFLLSGCGDSKGKVLATVNGEPIYVEDFKRSLALNLKRNPMFKMAPNTVAAQMSMLIDKKILIQEAAKRKLDRTGRFINTITTFWEQTLIRDLMLDQESKVKKSLTVSDDEVQKYYDKLTHKKTFQIIKSGDRVYISKSIAKNPRLIKWDETIGPVGFDEISSDILKKAFLLPRGRMEVYKEGEGYCLVYVKDDRAVDLGNFDEIKETIKQKILTKKRTEQVQSWMDSIREKSEININEDVLKKETGVDE